MDAEKYPILSQHWPEDKVEVGVFMMAMNKAGEVFIIGMDDEEKLVFANSENREGLNNIIKPIKIEKDVQN